jgi:hypothetical protein
MTLVDAVARWLALNSAWLGRHSGVGAPTGLAEARPNWIGPPPTLSNQPPPQELERMLHIARSRGCGLAFTFLHHMTKAAVGVSYGFCRWSDGLLEGASLTIYGRDRTLAMRLAA